MHIRNSVKFVVTFVICTLFMNCLYTASATENSSLLKLLYKKVDDSYFYVDVTACDIPSFSAAAISVGFNSSVVQLCHRDGQEYIQKNTYGKIGQDEVFDDTSVIEFDSNFTNEPYNWDGELLFNDIYPCADNDKGIVKMLFFRMAGAKEITGELRLFRLYFKYIDNGDPNIKIADNMYPVYDITNPKGVVFAVAGKELDVRVKYEGEIFEDHKAEEDETQKNESNGSSSVSNSSSGKKTSSDSNGDNSKPVNTDKYADSDGNLNNGETAKLPPSDESSTPEFKYEDISGVEWAHEAIYALSKKGIINGRGNNLFAPNASVTRAELAKMITLALELDLSDTSEASFDDVDAAMWYAPSVSTAYKAGIIKGYSENEFGPEDEVKRQDVCLMLHRAFFNSQKADLKAEFNDINEISDYAFDAVCYMYENGVVSGKENMMFDPHSGTTRAEAAKIIYNCLIN